jgi:GntR family transcriptional regulator
MYNTKSQESVTEDMDPNWNDNQPIYRQLRDRVVAMILEGVLKEGDPLPSVRNVAAEFQLNPLTVLKGYQALVDEGLVEKRRGLGMFVLPGARKQLMASEREQFIREEWPRILERIERLDLDIKTLLMSKDGRYAGAPGGSAPAKQRDGKKTGDK